MAEKKLKALERKRQLKRDQLGREVKLGALTVKRHEKEWKEMLFKIALPRMKEELEIAWHNYERIVDCKDFTISLLMDEIRDAEVQYMQNFQNHIENVHKLIQMFNDRLEDLKRDNFKELQKRNNESVEETMKINVNAAEGQEDIRTMLFMLKLDQREQEQIEKVEYFSKLDEEDSRYVQYVQTLKGTLENKYQYIWKITQDFIEEYNKRNKSRKKEYNSLTEQDSFLQNLQKLYLEEIANLKEYVKKLKKQFIHLQNKLGQQIKDLTFDLQFFSDAFMKLKKKLEHDRQKDFNQLKISSVQYDSTKNALTKIENLGKHILELATSCRKLETQEEKIMSFPTNILKEEIKKEAPLHIDCYQSALQLFWQRVAQVDASRYAINEEREFLKAENEILKFKIYEYCQCLNSECSLEIVHSKPNNITEGVLEMKKYQK